MKEIWRDVVGYEGDYQVSNKGRVKSFKKKKETILKPSKGERGYHSHGLIRNRKSKSLRAHRLVAMAFIPNPENKKCINHIDCNKINNNVDNLEWVTHKENMVHAYKNGLYKNANRRRKVIQFDNENNIIKEFISIKEASLKTKANKTSISLCCSGIQYTAGGFVWKYKDKYIK